MDFKYYYVTCDIFVTRIVAIFMERASGQFFTQKCQKKN